MAKRTRITRPYPTHSFQEAVPIAETIQRVNGGLPVETDLLATEMGTSARSSSFIQKLNASAKYGLTVGSYSDDFVKLTELGESVTAPGSAEEREGSILEAVTKPEVFSEFYRIYAGKRMPEDIYASNTLVRELGVPQELTEECLSIIRRNGLVAGIVADQAGVLVVGAVNDSEDIRHHPGAVPNGGGYYHEPGEEDRENYGSRPSAAGGEMLVAGSSHDALISEVVGLLEGLSVGCKAVRFEGSSERIISQDISEALGPARGCILVWPRERGPDDEQIPDSMLWAALGAMAYRFKQKLVVVFPAGDDTSAGLAESDPDTTAIRVESGESVYPKLMQALVKSGIVRISVG